MNHVSQTYTFTSFVFLLNVLIMTYYFQITHQPIYLYAGRIRTCAYERRAPCTYELYTLSSVYRIHWTGYMH